MSNFSELELVEIKTGLQNIEDDFAELNEMFGSEGLNFSEASSEELSALDAALEDSDIVEGSGQSSGQLTLMAAADGIIDEQTFSEQGWWDKFKDKVNPINILKNKAKKLLQKLIRLVKKYSKLKTCVPGVTKAALLFKAGKFASSLKQAYSSYKCIKSRL